MTSELYTNFMFPQVSHITYLQFFMRYREIGCVVRRQKEYSRAGYVTLLPTHRAVQDGLRTATKCVVRNFMSAQSIHQRGSDGTSCTSCSAVSTCPGQGEQGVVSLCYSGTAGEGFTFQPCAPADHCRSRLTQLNPQTIFILAPILPSISRSSHLLSPLCFFRPVHFRLSHVFCMHRLSPLNAFIVLCMSRGYLTMLSATEIKWRRTVSEP